MRNKYRKWRAPKGAISREEFEGWLKSESEVKFYLVRAKGKEKIKVGTLDMVCGVKENDNGCWVKMIRDANRQNFVYRSRVLVYRSLIGEKIFPSWFVFTNYWLAYGFWLRVQKHFKAPLTP